MRDINEIELNVLDTDTVLRWEKELGNEWSNWLPQLYNLWNNEDDSDTMSFFLMEAYISFNGSCNNDMVREMFEYSNQKLLMDNEDKEFYNSLPNEITIYRAQNNDGNELGFSWTTSLEVAEKFKNRCNGVIYTATINKEEIKCATNARNEFEVIVLDVEIKQRYE